MATGAPTGLRAQGTVPREFPDDPPVRRAAPPALAPAVTVIRGSYTSIQVNAPGGANVALDAGNEPSIAVDPADPNRIVIGWRQFDTIFSNFREAGVATSDDGGRTWTYHGVLQEGVFRSDPVLAVDADGVFYYNSLTVINGTEYRCDVFRSTDGGQSWLAPVFAYGGDKQWMTIDRTGGMGSGHVYEAWSTAGNLYGTNTFSRSTNGGAGFSAPSAIPNTPIWGTMDVGPDGTLWVAGIAPGNASVFYAAKSTNAQDASSPTTFTTTALGMGGAVRSFVPGPNPGGLYGQVGIAVDHSNGPTAGNVYVLCSVDPSGTDPLDVHFARSTDGGATWSAPVRINDDVGNHWNWFGTMSLAPNGRIDVVWNDTRNGAGNNYLCETYYSFSTDGGSTWSASVPISPQWDSHLGWPSQQKIGDYYHMVSDDVGAHLAYAATFNGEQDVWYVRIGDYDCNANGVPDAQDIAAGTSYDTNDNDIPDECEGIYAVPTVSQWGQALLFVLLAMAALWILRRHRYA